MQIAEGTCFGRYEIRSLLGAGGMGWVYLAQDTQLRRQVAIKLLPSEFTQDKDKLRRFKQEAYTASALNHPNILTIYEIGSEAGLHFIATEFVDGETLRQRMVRTRMAIREALDVAAQIAGALAVAHDAGIVHRDIKPENIMSRHDGIIKVLDFGLAKLAPQTTKFDSAAPTEALSQTKPGVVMGTVSYMSPEQARGLPLDGRTDIWSLGVVLYELVTGQAPFRGPTASDVIASILKTEPPLPQLYSPEVSPELQRILRKAVRKDPEERYQIAKELALDLKNLNRDLEIEKELERSVQPATRGSGAVKAAGQGAIEESASRTTQVVIPPPTSSAEYLVGEIKRHQKGVLAGLTLFLVVLSLAVFWAYQSWQSVPAKQPSLTMKIARLTTSGKANLAAISPDGKYAVHVASEDGQQSLRVRQVNTISEVQIVPPAEVRYTGLTFSRDGDFIYYVASEKNSPLAVLYQVPTLGGTARRLISDVGSNVTFAPDGKHLAFIRNFVEQGEQALMMAGADGSGERRVAVRKFPNFFHSVSWSPDGKSIACAAGSYVPNYNSYVVVVPVEGGLERQTPSPSWFSMGEVAWLPDGSGLILDASELSSASLDSSQLWYLASQSGEARRITNDLNNYSGVSLTGDSNRLVTVQSETISNIWLIPHGETSRASQLTFGATKQDGREGIAWAADGKIVFVSKASGNDDIWIMNPDGTNQKQLTSSAGINSSPAVSPDGRFIVFTSTRAGALHIWRMDIDGNNPRQLTSGSGEDYPQVSPDSKWVVYTLFTGKTTLWRVSVEGGAPFPVSDKLTSSPVISPDGKWIASIYREEKPNSPALIAITPFAGGEPAKILDMPKSDWGSLRWMPDRSLGYVVTTGGVSNIWSQPLAGGEPKQLTDFKTEKIFWFDWSRDSSQIACARGAETDDVILISNFR